jgi:hypothetical protein
VTVDPDALPRHVPTERPTAHLLALRGHLVDVVLSDGRRFDGCRLISVGRLRAHTIWVLDGDNDIFLEIDQIRDVTQSRIGHPHSE